jgi:hypothetical protein
MARNTTCTSEMDLNGQLRADLVFFDVIKAVLY